MQRLGEVGRSTEEDTAVRIRMLVGDRTQTLGPTARFVSRLSYQQRTTRTLGLPKWVGARSRVMASCVALTS